MPRAQICQVALCTSSIPSTTQLFSRAMGFTGAGGRPLWGNKLANMHELTTGHASAIMMWWLVGRQDLMQLELFTHTTPPQRQVSRRPHDLGWSRWGAVVDDFDRLLTGLALADVPTITPPMTERGARRVAFREPGSGVVVEAMERLHSQPTSDRDDFYRLGASVRYVTRSVRDLEGACALFLAAGLVEVDPASLHRPEHEALWGLDGASRDLVVLSDGDVALELARYRDPEGAPLPDDHSLSDQGFMNIAVGFRDPGQLAVAYDAMIALGCESRVPMPVEATGTYLKGPEKLSVELLLAPREMDAEYGFAPLPNIPRPPTWPTHR